MRFVFWERATAEKCRGENDLHDPLHAHSARTIFAERENHDVTTTETHIPASGWHAPSLFACHYVPDGTKAGFETKSFVRYQ